ncbi:MAG: hypothetical protein ACKO6N_21310 [Myxococcota bacterium]
MLKRKASISMQMVLLISSVALATGCGAGAGEDLNGTWATSCFYTGASHARTVLTYTDLALKGNYTEYDDESCTNAIHSSDWTGTVEVSGKTEAGDTKIDIAFATFTSTPLTADNAALNNGYYYCGFSDWEANVEKDVLGADCYGYSIPVGGKSLDIYRITEDTLLFGTDAPIGTDLTEDQRPTTIDETRVFTRQE